MSKSKEVAVVKKEKKLAWGGAVPRIGEQEKNVEIVKQFCNQVAVIYGVPSVGVNSMAGQPYLNKEARLFLLHDLKKGKERVKSMRTEFIQLSTGLDVPSIAKRTIEFMDGLIVEAIGEASKDSVKLTAVKMTLNMMAETRATNRAIWQAISGQVMNRVSQNLAKMGAPAHVQNIINKAGTVSYEEATPEEVGNMFEDAAAKIQACKSVDTLQEYDKKIQGSKKYSTQQKEDLHNLIDFQVDVINENASKG